MDYFLGLDALSPFTNSAQQIADAGFTYVLRYLKNLTSDEVRTLLDVGVAIGLIFEQGTGNAFNGASQGAVDGGVALAQAQALGAPPGTTIFFTVDGDLDPQHSSAQLAAIGDYGVAFAAAIDPYLVGAYACGTVLYQFDLGVSWLAGAMGWSGSHSYDNDGLWTVKQGPTLSHGGSWCGVQWPDLGREYDPDLATNLEWAWQPAGGILPRPQLPTLRRGDSGRAVIILQDLLNRHPIVVDGDFGKTTDYRVRAFQAQSGLTDDGIVGPKTWDALLKPAS